MGHKKYKLEIPAKDATAGGGQGAEAKPERNVRARLTVRGFKDTDKADIDRYAGTSSKCSQKLLVSEAVQDRWPVLTGDISECVILQCESSKSRGGPNFICGHRFSAYYQWYCLLVPDRSGLRRSPVDEGMRSFSQHPSKVATPHPAGPDRELYCGTACNR